jgi:hypothetical protein
MYADYVLEGSKGTPFEGRDLTYLYAFIYWDNLYTFIF